MRVIRRSVLGAAAAISVSALGAPIAGAQVFPFPGAAGWAGTGFGVGGATSVIGQANGPIGCDASSPVGNGFAGGTTSNGCWSGAAGVGPAIGEMANVTGPVVTGSALLAPIVVSAGSTLGGD
jgi:hypothetical protein